SFTGTELGWATHGILRAMAMGQLDSPVCFGCGTGASVSSSVYFNDTLHVTGVLPFGTPVQLHFSLAIGSGAGGFPLPSGTHKTSQPGSTGARALVNATLVLNGSATPFLQTGGSAEAGEGISGPTGYVEQVFDTTVGATISVTGNLVVQAAPKTTGDNI